MGNNGQMISTLEENNAEDNLTTAPEMNSDILSETEDTASNTHITCHEEDLLRETEVITPEEISEISEREISLEKKDNLCAKETITEKRSCKSPPENTSKKLKNDAIVTEPNEAIDFKFDDTSLSKSTDPHIQECRSDLRERFLWAMTGLTGKHTEISMLENLNVSGTLRGVDKDGLLVHIQNLKTPSTEYSYSTLRLPDCLSLKFKLNS